MRLPEGVSGAQSIFVRFFRLRAAFIRFPLRYLTNALLTGLAMTGEATMTQPVLCISDDGKDLDDELAKVLMNALERRELVKCHGSRAEGLLGSRCCRCSCREKWRR